MILQELFLSGMRMRALEVSIGMMATVLPPPPVKTIDPLEEWKEATKRAEFKAQKSIEQAKFAILLANEVGYYCELLSCLDGSPVCSRFWWREFDYYTTEIGSSNV
ncbi:hypothetical protein EHQ90_16885 [Leptospira stimsonii]|uniref:Uncharacterized protein n=1 Tax=Leptospira stimsonii TaxID=2202203 RepID=A0ABY2MXR2_9LEPT|nr:hypothetical protein EHQ90_16885 [Leptospira stimsonii]